MANTPATPRTWVAAEITTAAHMNSDVRDNTDYILTSAPAVRVFNAAAISITTSGVAQALTFDSERYDAGSGMHSTVTNTGRLTVPTGCGGKYLIGATVSFASNATGARQVTLRVNGTTSIASDMRAAVGGGEVTFISICTEYALAAGDYVEVMAYQTSGGALNALGLAAGPEFWATWVRT